VIAVKLHPSEGTERGLVIYSIQIHPRSKGRPLPVRFFAAHCAQFALALSYTLIEAWSAMQQCVIDKAVDEWRKRFRFCVSAKGGHFEHKLYNY